MKELVKATARGLATIAVLPNLVSFYVRAAIMGPDRALEGSSQVLSLAPGVLGQYLRRAFLARVLAGCAPTATIEFGVVFSQAGARLDDHAYVGPGSHLGLVHLETNVMIAAGVHIPSGRHTHGSDPSTPMREQQGSRTLVRIGAGSWIGSNAVVLADVGRDTIVGAGAVVTTAIPDRVVAAGVPARVLRSRDAAALPAV